MRSIMEAWCAETSADPIHWTAENPAWGQCAVTALVVQDSFGGDLVRVENALFSHYFNCVAGNYVDLTRNQFSTWDFTSPESRTREYVMSSPRTRSRYQLLCERLRRQGACDRPGRPAPRNVQRLQQPRLSLSTMQERQHRQPHRLHAIPSRATREAGEVERHWSLEAGPDVMCRGLSANCSVTCMSTGHQAGVSAGGAVSSNTERETMPIPTRGDIADLLHAAYDEMMIRGRSTGRLINEDGRVCLEGAIAVACGIDIHPPRTLEDNTHNANVTWGSVPYLMAKAAMAARGFNFIWNDKQERTDDDVLDAFLNTEKQLREEAT